MARNFTVQATLSAKNDAQAAIRQFKSSLQSIPDPMDDVRRAARVMGEATGAARNAFSSTVRVLTPMLEKALAAGAIGMGALTYATFDTIRAANEAQSAMLGLASVAGKKLGQEDVPLATAAAKELAQDGLMSVSEAAAGLKNLLASGFSLPEATNLMKGFKDSAAFGRQSALGFGEAIVGATEGIKNQNSVLVDNSGVTKNLSMIIEEAGYSMQDLGKVTTDTNIRAALYNGLLKEMSLFQGDAAKLTDTFAGKQALLSTRITEVKQKVGEVMQTALMPFYDHVLKMIDQFGGAEGISKKVADFVYEIQNTIGVAKELANTYMPKMSEAINELKKAWAELREGKSGEAIELFLTAFTSATFKVAVEGAAIAVKLLAGSLKELDAVMESLAKKDFLDVLYRISGAKFTVDSFKSQMSWLDSVLRSKSGNRSQGSSGPEPTPAWTGSSRGSLGFAEGGIVTRPTRAIIGEGGEPEAVIPLSRLDNLSGGGGGPTIVVQGMVPVSPAARREVAEMILDSINEIKDSRNGAYGL